MNIQIGFSRGTSAPARVISAASMLRHSTPYTFADGPATHAFLAFGVEGLRVRVDGQPPSSSMSLDGGGGARFELNSDGAQEAITHVNKLIGVPYDPIEFATQILSGFEMLDGVPSAAICTTLVLKFLDMAGLSVGPLRDRYPETLARALRSVPWARRL